MKLDNFFESASLRDIEGTQIRRNPENLSQWFVMVKTNDGASHMLVDDNDKPITKTNIEALLSILKQASLKSTEVIF